MSTLRVRTHLGRRYPAPQVTISQAGGNTTLTGRDLDFQLSSGPAEMTLILPLPGGPYEIWQSMTVTTRGPSPPTITSDQWSTGTGRPRATRDGRHPRLLSSAGASAGRSSQAAYIYEADLTFIDVTHRVEHGAGLGRFADPAAVRSGERPAGVRVLFVEHTESPPAESIWAVAVPSRLWENQRTFHFVLFLRPSPDAHYTSPETLQVSSYPGETAVERYLLSPATDPNNPFFVRQYRADDALEATWYNDRPRCGFLDQLDRTAAAVVLATPLGPRRWGAINTSQADPRAQPFDHPRSLRELNMSLRRALHADGHVGLRLGTLCREADVRVAFGGFSFAADQSIDILRRNVQGNYSAIDEFYWFDPTNQKMQQYANGTFFDDWLRGADARGRERRLAVICGLEHVSALRLQSTLAASHGGRVMVRPPPNFWQNALVYEHAVAWAPDPKGVTFPETMSSAGTTGALTPFTRDTGVFDAGHATTPLAQAGGHEEVSYQLQGGSPQGSTPHRSSQATVNCVGVEVVGFTRFQFINNARNPHLHSKNSNATPATPTLAAQLDTHIRSHMGIRHQWSVVGGDYLGPLVPPLPTRSPPFRGYIQLCLDRGVFP